MKELANNNDKYSYLQQEIYTNATGNHNWDRAVVQHLRTNPDLCAKHLDAKEYLQRRTEYFYNDAPKRYPQSAENFKAIVAASPEAKAFVSEKLVELGVKDPEKWLATPLTRMAYVMDTPTQTSRGNTSQSQSQGITMSDEWDRGERR